MKTRFFAFAALALTLAACNNDNENLNDGPVAAKFIADITPATRVNSEGTEWTEGDRIGVTGAGFTNVPYKREYGMFVPDGTVIYFDDTETHTFHAYYPYQAEGGTVTVSTAADKQGTGIDFLFASGATGDTHNPTVSFTDKTDKGGEDNSFHHCMSLIKFTFKAGDGIIFNGMEPASYTLGGLKHEGTFDTATGMTAVTAAANSPINMQLNGAPESARPGDLIFFEKTYDTAGASHVGIYVGNNRMLHCGDPIHYASIDTSYWRSHFLQFGRLP